MSESNSLEPWFKREARMHIKRTATQNGTLVIKMVKIAGQDMPFCALIVKRDGEEKAAAMLTKTSALTTAQALIEQALILEKEEKSSQNE